MLQSMAVDSSFAESLALTFLPLFIAIDALGALPFIISAGEGLGKKEQRKMANVAILTTTVVGLIFLFFGQFVLKLMGISVGSFAIGGGLILLSISIHHLLTGNIVDIKKEEMVAVVPIGTPLLAGPATITTLLLLAASYPIYIVLLSFILNILIAWIIFMGGRYIAAFLGEGGLRAISRIFSLLLAAIAVNMIITGLDMIGILNLPV
jgi:multiple antibiotic resistance protein